MSLGNLIIISVATIIVCILAWNFEQYYYKNKRGNLPPNWTPDKEQDQFRPKNKLGRNDD